MDFATTLWCERRDSFNYEAEGSAKVPSYSRSLASGADNEEMHLSAEPPGGDAGSVVL